MLRPAHPSTMRFSHLAALALLVALGATIFLTGDGDAVDEPEPDGAASGYPQRILPGSAAAADWIGRLVDPDRVVALPVQVEKWSEIRLEPEPWTDTPRFPRFTGEAVLGHRPDLVLVSPFTDAAIVARVRGAGVEVLRVVEPPDWKELIENGRRIAEAVGEETTFELLAEGLEARRDALAARPHTSTLSVLPYGNYGAEGFTSGSDTTIDLAIRTAGFRNAAAEMGVEGSGRMTDEMILSTKFDAVLVGGDVTFSQSASALIGKDALRDVPAIRDKRFIALNAALYASGSFTILDAAEEIARQGDELGPR